MSNLTLRSNIPSVRKFSIGFDSLFDELERLDSRAAGNYPPYNIVQLSEDEYEIQVAVAGFAFEDLIVTKDKNLLIIEGNHEHTSTETTYLHRGIGLRNFSREFRLADHVEVTSATLDLGILAINLKREIPENEKPKTIVITSNQK